MATTIQQGSGFLGDLLGSVRGGKLVPASFQRPYVWEEEDVLAFWKSLLRHWPTGTYLLWDPMGRLDLGRIARTRLGPVEVVPDRYVNVILDGQNRLASYAWSLLAADAPLPGGSPLSDAEARVWGGDRRLVADAPARAIRFAALDEIRERPGELMPAGHFSDTHAMNSWMRRAFASPAGVGDEELSWIGDVADRAIREARVSFTTIGTPDPQEALEAFRHVARTGVPMSDEDFEAAMSFAFDAPTPSP